MPKQEDDGELEHVVVAAWEGIQGQAGRLGKFEPV